MLPIGERYLGKCDVQAARLELDQFQVGTADSVVEVFEVMSCMGESGSNLNSSRPRDACRASGIFPSFAISLSSRTSTKGTTHETEKIVR
jgi:hypothetical protein